MRIFLIEPVGAGGMIHFAYQLCSALSAEGADVVLITASDYELAALPHNFAVEPLMRLWPRFDDVLTESPPATSVGRAWRRTWWTARRATRAIRLVREWVRVVGYVRHERPDVAHFGTPQFPGARFFLDRLRGITLTQICHEFEFRESKYRWSNDIRTRLLRRTFEPFDAIFVLGDEVKNRFHQATGYPRRKIHTIPHGNEALLMTDPGDLSLLRQTYGFGDDDRIVLFFGNIRPSKGVPDLIDAFAELSDLDDVKLLIAGYPSREIDTKELRTRAEEMGVAERVVFDIRYIPIEEVSSLIALATVVAFPYVTATQSGAIQVAFAGGRPVVATAVGSIPEAVEDGTTGFLVPQGSTEAMANALRRLVIDPALAEDMGKAALGQANARFGWGAIAREVLSVYRDLSPSRGRSSADGHTGSGSKPLGAARR